MSRQDRDLASFDPEIERTFRRRRREQLGLCQVIEMADQGGGENDRERENNEREVVLDDRDRALNAFAQLNLDGLNSSIVQPEIEALHFELKPVMFQMLQTINGVTDDILKLKLFPYSLRDRARAWLNSLPSDSITTWNDLAEKFLMKYFPPTKNAKLRNDITSFQQLEGESLYETWERYKELLRRCPHHGIPFWIQMETFYNGLNAQTTTIVDAASNGALMSKTYNEAYALLERMASNNYQWPTERVPAGRRMAGVHEVSEITSLIAQIASLVNTLNNQQATHHQSVNSVQGIGESCVLCNGTHRFESCPSNPKSVCYVGNMNRNNNPFSNTYNPGWRQHPNFSWSNQGAGQGSNSVPQRPQFPPGFQQQQKPQTSEFPSSMESLLKEYMARNDAVIQSQAASLRNLENQVWQLANELKNRPPGTLPSNTESPKRDGKEHCKAITLRGGKTLEAPEINEKNQKELKESREAENSGENSEKSGANAAAMPQQNFQQKRPPPPFPQQFKKQQQDHQFRRFLDVLKQLHINIPLVEALEQMPNYVKFMKDMLTKKRRFGEFETVALTRECSAVLQNKLPPKLKDPGSFAIPCSIGNRYFGKALCDLGATRPTTVSLQLADRSIAHPEGKIEDVLVKVDKFIFPVDFIVFDYEADLEVPIILGRPFLATGRTLIDVQKGELTMRVQDEHVTFNVFQSMKFPSDMEECSVISLADSLVAEQLERCCEDSLQSTMLDDSNLEDEIEEEWAWIETKQGVGKQKMQFESLDMSAREFKLPKFSVDESPALELKPLPSHLRYSYLGNYSTFPVIISAFLIEEQEGQLLEVLKIFKKAIGWTLADIKGISHSFCLHKIMLEDNEKGSIEAQRRLNPIMKEVVKKKIIKWPDKTKAWHDKRIHPRNFEVGQQALLFNSRLMLFPGKLKSCWSRLFRIAQSFPFGAVELEDEKYGRKFKVNGQRIKHYFGGEVDRQQDAMPLHDG
ncbi:hypothetical protein UlMin_000898 [Ulmus minor]